MSQKKSFWEAFILTVFIFALGIMAGFLLENWRSDKITTLYQNSEIELLDINLQSEIYSLKDFNCESSIQENMEFADRIYEEASLLEKYQRSEILTKSNLAHQKYDLLRIKLLINSIIIRKNCNNSYNEIAYFYKFNDASSEIIAKESVFSNLLLQVKQEKGNSLLLIPIAVDTNIRSAKSIMSQYNVTEQELPVIVINGKVKISELETKEEILKNLN